MANLLNLIIMVSLPSAHPSTCSGSRGILFFYHFKLNKFKSLVKWKIFPTQTKVNFLKLLDR